MYRIVFLPKANQDILYAANWYSSEGSATVSTRFKKSVLLEVEKLKSDLVEHGIVYSGLSRVFVKHFPYTIYFVKDSNKKRIVVYAVLHNKQSRSALGKGT